MLDQVEITLCPEPEATAILAPQADLFEPLAVLMLTQYKQLAKQNYKNFILDLTKVEAISAAGLGMLRYLMSEVAERQGFLPLTCRSEKVVRLLKISGLLEELKVVKSVADGLAYIQQEAA